MTSAIDQARAYIAPIPGGIQGSGGSGQTFAVAMAAVEGFALPESDALVVLREYNARCSPPWSEPELLHKVQDAIKIIDPTKLGGKLHHNGNRNGRQSTPVEPVERWAALRIWRPSSIREMGGRNQGGVVAFSTFINGKEVGVRMRKPDGTLFEFPNGQPHKSHTPKGQQLGLFFSKSMLSGEIPSDTEIDLFEGEADCCAAVDAGAQYVIGLPGAKFKPEVMAYLQRLLAGRRGQVTMFPDPGKDGEKCARNVALALRSVGVELMIAPPPGTDDLDARLRREADKPEALRQWRDTAIPASTIYQETPPGAGASTSGSGGVARRETEDVLELPGGEQSITACAEKLFGRLAKTGRFFRRGGRVVTVHHEDDNFSIEIVSPEAMRSIPEQYFRTFVWRGDGRGNPALKPSPVSRDQAAAMLECPARDILPELRGLLGSPIMLSDGRVIGPGFDISTGIYITGGDMPVDVPINEATEMLKRVLVDFDFVSPGDYSRALAGLITPTLRLGGFIPFTPMDVAEADQSQAGKGYRHKLVAALHRDAVQIVAQRSSGGVGSFDESLASRLQAGGAFIQFDNLRGKIDSPYLESLQTAERKFPCRVPHKGELMIDPSRFYTMATSNAVEMTPDLANRSSIIRIRKQPEGYPFKKYPEGDVLDHIRAHQSYFLGCVFSVVRAWIDAGRPQTDESRHDFRFWARSLDWIVQNLFHAAPLMDGHGEAKRRISDPTLSFVRLLAVTIDYAGHLGKGMSASEIYEFAESNNVTIPGLREPDDRQGPRAVGKILGRFMDGRSAGTVDDYLISVEARNVPRPDGNGYFDMKFYRIDRMAPGSQNGKTTVAQLTTVEGTTSLGNCALSNKVLGSTVVNCGTQSDAKDLLDRLAARGVVVKLNDVGGVVILGHPTPEENAELDRLDPAIKALLLDQADADLFRGEEQR